MITATTPKGERRRQALVAAAAELLLEGGFDAVRHRSVATRADLPLASTTYYFESLEDLIARAVEFSGNAELEAMRRRRAGGGPTPPRRPPPPRHHEAPSEAAGG
ncbi:TetR family transcriptional regulator, partial [Nocardia wallacei]|uniref:TetR family transcriptional regulator n=1 Tax=Nocardia wallacei TaxID=480035 RepID=UPI0024571491